MNPQWTFGQRDPQWANWLLNNVAGSTLGKYGCTTAAYGVGLGYYLGKPMNPKDTEIFIRQNKAYLGDLVDWRFLPYFRWRFYCEAVPAPLEDIKNELRAGKMVLLNVNLVRNDLKPDHWVICLDENFTIFDPWFNEIAPITKRYGNPSTEIYGGAYFNWPAKVEKPTEQPQPPVKTITMEEIFSNIFITFFERWPTPEELAEFKNSGEYGRPYTYVQNKWVRQWKGRAADLEKEVQRLYKSEKDKDALADQLRQAIKERDEDLKQKGGSIEEITKAKEVAEARVSEVEKATQEQVEAMQIANAKAVETARQEGYNKAKSEFQGQTPPTPQPEPIPAYKTGVAAFIEYLIKLISKK